MSNKKILTTVASVLATALLAIPATPAQASVEWHSNGLLVGAARQETNFWGNWEVQNAVLGKIKCHVIGTLPVWNEVGLAKTDVELIATGSCTAEPPCSGVFMTAEAPVEAILRENAKHEKVAEAKRGPIGLPWEGEGLEVQEGLEKVRKVKFHVADLNVVAPCFSLEVPFEGTLEAKQFNGAKNGMHPSHLEFGVIGTSGELTTKVLPTTGEENLLRLAPAPITDVGEMIQLITLE